MDQTKEVFPKAAHNIAKARGAHVLAMDGPGQGSSNVQKIRAVRDNYGRAGAAVISYIAKRPEVDADRIAIYGISMGSYWSLRLASCDRRVAAVVSAVACFNPNNTIFTGPPRASNRELTAQKELWVLENQYHPLWSIGNLGGLDVHDYALDWLQGLYSGHLQPTRQGRIAYVREGGSGPWSDCEWQPPIGPAQPYF
jgi:alpha-beta hydrolase superfamily lysophospholipase